MNWFVIEIEYSRELWIEAYYWRADIGSTRFIIWQVVCFASNKWICKLLNSSHSTRTETNRKLAPSCFPFDTSVYSQMLLQHISSFLNEFSGIFGAYLQWAWDTYEYLAMRRTNCSFSRVSPNLLSECVNLNLYISISIDVYRRQFLFAALKCILAYAFEWIESLWNWFSRIRSECTQHRRTILEIFR